MFLESLEVDNFKSFGSKRRIVFRKGFTVISGPNGSGKSNIGDAIVFVMGTRSSKFGVSLREFFVQIFKL